MTLPPRFHAGSIDTALDSIRGFDDEPVTPQEADALDRKAEAEAAAGLSQLDRALRALAALQPTSPAYLAAKALSDIVDEAQNSPPDGLSDGSIGVKQWYALRLVTTAFNNFNDALIEALVQKP